MEVPDMKQLKYLAVLLCLAAAAVSAQPPGGPGGHHGGPGFGGRFDIDQLAILLDLDDYQKGQVQSVLKEQRDAMVAERKEHQASGQRPSFEEMRAQREQNREALLGKLATVLNDSQMAKFKILMAPPRGPGGPRGPRGPRGGEGAPPGNAPAGQ
jgi:Spy/CpxP family protein refolding chaperone